MGRWGEKRSRSRVIVFFTAHCPSQFPCNIDCLLLWAVLREGFFNGLLINPDWVMKVCCSSLNLAKLGCCCVYGGQRGGVTCWWPVLLMAEAGKDSGESLILLMAQGGEEWTKMSQVYVIPRVLCFNIYRNFSWPSKTKQKGNQNK